MKKGFVIAAISWIQISILTAAVSMPSLPMLSPNFDEMPKKFMTSSLTSSLEWGCPVSEVVAARTKAEALGKIEGECRAQVQREAVTKPDVLNVIQTELIFPDVQVTEANGGYYLNGTFFLETLVMRRVGTEK